MSGWVACLALLGANAPVPPPGELDVQVQGLRSAKGLVRACLTRDVRFFPHCDRDPHSLKLSIAAAPNPVLRFPAVAPGDYALMVLHDENANARVDTLLGIPREGIGFSRNPRLIMGPPRFDSVRFGVTGAESITVRLQYFL